MDWFMILISVVILWVASLCKILHTSCSPSKAVFLENGEPGHQKNILLVIAHPDDESMFFSPTVAYLTSRGHNLHILCTSTGNADGMGDIRKEELYEACAIFKVPLSQVKVIDHPDLQARQTVSSINLFLSNFSIAHFHHTTDGFGQTWDHNLLAKIIKEEVTTHSIDSIITFDNYGVSGHCNHCDVHHGTRKFLHQSSGGNVEAWELISTNLIRKYCGPVDIWLSTLSALQSPRGQMHCLLNEHPRRSYHAMAQHRSQWVWFRKLFVSFSSYTYVNTLRKINY
ncbi:N-acetylglucosaminyl phosphatidylinositol deacetylase-related [Dillenia turbinata]|uniref:N-acetylglucosaminylphosphatidylinositol deacetylase n=1 Tax=Dillenia turbinata TaxID=194707 RepID=A0AAN8VWV1_9MAGN